MEVLRECCFGAVAASFACVFSNPLEVVKTRMQLQGELKNRGTYTVHYRNVFHAFFTIGKVDGLLALQSGLGPGIAYQILMNGARLGSYQTIINSGLANKKDGKPSYLKCMGAGAVSGCLGALCGSPAYMVKTQLQASTSSNIAVGTQHNHSGSMNALLKIYKQYGVFGLWRGVSGALARVTFGSAAQLSTFSQAKSKIAEAGIFSPGSILIPFTSSMISSIAVVTIMTPFDVISTRLYNQPVDNNGRGTMYNGIGNCASKIYIKEGFFGLYKGIGASYFRLGPHTVLSLMFWDKLRVLYDEYK